MGDPQREHVYRAEERVPPGAQLYNPHQLDRYVKTLTRSSWWRDHEWPDVRVIVTPSAQYPVEASGGWTPAAGYHVRLPAFKSPEVEDVVVWSARAGRPVDPGLWPWAWRELTICHELAHVTLLAEEVNPDHGPAFAARYLETLAAVRGAGAALDLARAFAGERVEVGELWLTTAEPLSPEALSEAAWKPYEPTSFDDIEREHVEQGALL